MYGTSNSKLYEEMGWVSLAERRDQAKLVYMYKIVNNLVPRYLNNIIPETSTAYNTRTVTNLPHFRARTDTFDKSFFPSGYGISFQQGYVMLIAYLNLKTKLR